MNKRRRLGLIVVLGVAITAAAFFALRPREPVYEGKKLGEWLKIFANETGGSREQAAKVIHQIGTHSLPILIEMLRSKDSWIDVKLIQLASKQSLVKLNFTSEKERRSLAILAIQELGLAARPALPALIELLNHPDTTDCASEALVPLSATYLGPEELLVLAKSFTNENLEVRERVMALLDIRGHGRSKSLIATALIEYLKDESPAVRLSAIQSAISLSEIHWVNSVESEPVALLPALKKRLDDDSAAVRSAAAQALCHFSLQAGTDVPLLLKHINDPDERVRQSVAAALRTIDPEAAGKAGVK